MSNEHDTENQAAPEPEQVPLMTADEDTRSWDGYAIRIDAHLRANYPHLSTRIFEISPSQYQIYLNGDVQSADELRDHYENGIRFAAVGAHLTNTIPGAFIKELTPLTDREALGEFKGLPLTRIELDGLLLSRFRDTPVLGLDEDIPYLNVVSLDPLEEDLRHDVETFINDLGLPLITRFKLRSELPQADPTTPSPVFEDPGQRMLIRPARLRDTAPSFVQRDEDFFFEQLARATNGELSVERFPGINPERFRCYIDLSRGLHLNLRQLLLVYDEVFGTLPSADRFNELLAQQGLRREEILEIVETGRITFISNQPEENLDVSFLDRIAERRIDALIGRRKSTLLLISDIVQTANEYKLADPALLPAIKQFAEHIGPSLNVPTWELLKILLWPQVAARQSLSRMIGSGTKYGPSTPLSEIASQVIDPSRMLYPGIDLAAAAERIHIGHALNATVIGALDENDESRQLSALLGRELNFYRGFNTSIAASWASNEERRFNGVQIVPTIDLLDFDPGVPMSEFLSDASLGSTRSMGRSLISRLADMPSDERPEEINRILARYRARSRGGRVLSLDNLDTTISLASVVGSFVYPPIMGLAHLSAPLVDRARRIPAIDRMLNSLSEDTSRTFGRNQDLAFLDRISRVSQIKRPRV